MGYRLSRRSHARGERFPPAATIHRRNSSARRDLPTPASPSISTIRPAPPATAFHDFHQSSPFVFPADQAGLERRCAGIPLIRDRPGARPVPHRTLPDAPGCSRVRLGSHPVSRSRAARYSENRAIAAPRSPERYRASTARRAASSERGSDLSQRSARSMVVAPAPLTHRLPGQGAKRMLILLQQLPAGGGDPFVELGSVPNRETGEEAGDLGGERALRFLRYQAYGSHGPRTRSAGSARPSPDRYGRRLLARRAGA